MSTLGQNLSLGTKRKLQLAFTLIGGNPILVLDEITSGLDIESRKNIWEVIKNLKTKRTIIFCSQHLEEADELADRICLIKDGKIKSIQTTYQLKKEYSNGF